LSTERMVSFLASAFGLIATILASISLYVVLSMAVARWLKEIGIRIALGAESASVIRLVLGEIAMPILGGMVVGVLAAWIPACRATRVNPLDVLRYD